MKKLKLLLVFLPMLCFFACSPYMAVVKMQVDKTTLDSSANDGVEAELSFSNDDGEHLFKVKTINNSGTPIKVDWTNCIVSINGISSAFINSDSNRFYIKENPNYLRFDDDRNLIGAISNANYIIPIAPNSFGFSPTSSAFNKSVINIDAFDTIKKVFVKNDLGNYHYKNKAFNNENSPQVAQFILIYSKMNDAQKYFKTYTFFVNSITLFSSNYDFLVMYKNKNNMVFKID